MQIYHILLIFTPLVILIFLGKKFPLQIGQYIYFWVGPKPKEGLSGRTYFLHWAKTTFFYLITMIISFVIGILILVKNGFDFDKNPIIAGILFFAMPILIVAGVVRLFEFLIKSYIHRNEKITLKQTIYIPLVDEGVDVWHPVEAEWIKVNIFKIISENESSGEEQWAFSTGDYVRCEEKKLQNKNKALVAVDKIAIEDN